MTAQPHNVTRRLIIRARPDTVFSFFTDSARWAAWWGAGSTIDARPGGRVLIRYPNGVEASGHVLEVVPPERIVFTYGYATGRPSPPGSTRVTLGVDPHPEGSVIHLVHELPDAASRDEHVQGWRFQLSLFANAIAGAARAGAEDAARRWFEIWSEPDAATRAAGLTALAAPHVLFRDQYACVEGIDDLAAHVAAIHRFMPGQRVSARGPARWCQWSLLIDWAVAGDDGADRQRGTNVFAFDADGRIAGVTGFWH